MKVKSVDIGIQGRDISVREIHQAIRACLIGNPSHPGAMEKLIRSVYSQGTQEKFKKIIWQRNSWWRKLGRWFRKKQKLLYPEVLFNEYFLEKDFSHERTEKLIGNGITVNVPIVLSNIKNISQEYEENTYYAVHRAFKFQFNDYTNYTYLNKQIIFSMEASMHFFANQKTYRNAAIMLGVAHQGKVYKVALPFIRYQTLVKIPSRDAFGILKTEDTIVKGVTIEMPQLLLDVPVVYFYRFLVYPSYDEKTHSVKAIPIKDTFRTHITFPMKDYVDCLKTTLAGSKR